MMHHLCVPPRVSAPSICFPPGISSGRAAVGAGGRLLVLQGDGCWELQGRPREEHGLARGRGDWGQVRGHGAHTAGFWASMAEAKE